MKRFALIALFTLLFAGAVFAQNANVYVMHGIPGEDVNAAPSFPVDISVNNQCTLQAFTFRSVAGPLSLAPGTYAIAISAANLQNPCSNPTLISANVPVAAGEDVIIIAHLDATGAPTASKFVFDRSKAGPLNARFAAFHTAAAPAVDLRLRGFFFGTGGAFTNVTNGQSASVVVPYDFYTLGVFPADTVTPVLPLLTAPLLPDYTYLTFVVGSLKNNTLQPIFLIKRNR